jgi:hypothetical protein
MTVSRNGGSFFRLSSAFPTRRNAARSTEIAIAAVRGGCHVAPVNPLAKQAFSIERAFPDKR